jgi:hypothetical protein
VEWDDVPAPWGYHPHCLSFEVNIVDKVHFLPASTFQIPFRGYILELDDSTDHCKAQCDHQDEVAGCIAKEEKVDLDSWGEEIDHFENDVVVHWKTADVVGVPHNVLAEHSVLLIPS